MADTARTVFTKYFPLLLDALRSKDPTPMRPAEAIAWVRAHTTVPERELTTFIKNGQSLFENDVHWARFYLAKGGYIDPSRRGQWGLTAQGREKPFTSEDAWDLTVRVRDASRSGGTQVEEAQPAPGLIGDEDDGIGYWLVGSMWDTAGDQLPRYRGHGIWECQGDDQADMIRRIRPGDRIAVKASFVRKSVPFDVGGKPVSTMRIKATGIVLENPGDGRTVKVAWDPPREPRDWYFYTYRSAIAEINKEKEGGRRLIDFVFRGASQDLNWFLAQPYWQEKYGLEGAASPVETPSTPLAPVEDDDLNAEDDLEYTIADILEDGSFLTEKELTDILVQWRGKRNLILQGPPGTGKTWLAKRLGFALVGSKDRETARSRLRVVQFHPSLSYEDFVRGWRPAGDGRLALVDGILMQAIEAAQSEPDRPFVLVIEEVNRGNPAQIFGEMLTLLEASKRSASEAIELAYRKEPGERVHIPDNLYVIGTMNVADRSLALVDLALRRRFAFVNLEPRFGAVWRAFCVRRGLPEDLLVEIESRIRSLNDEIVAATTLGPNFRVGHSYVTPEGDASITDARAWFRARVETEIAPLLDEYWYDAPETAQEARSKLLKGFD